jgi:hypothetical protein
MNPGFFYDVKAVPTPRRALDLVLQLEISSISAGRHQLRVLKPGFTSSGKKKILICLRRLTK